MAYPNIIDINSIADALAQSSDWDALIVVAPKAEAVTDTSIKTALLKHQEIDARVDAEVLLFSGENVPGKRIVFAPTGELSRYYDDVRRYFDVANKAAKVAVSAGIRKPLMWVEAAEGQNFQNAIGAAYLGFTQGLWQPLEAREALREDDIEPIQEIGLITGDSVTSSSWLMAAEAGKRVARDLCGTEPERMAPPRFCRLLCLCLSG